MTIKKYSNREDAQKRADTEDTIERNKHSRIRHEVVMLTDKVFTVIKANMDTDKFIDVLGEE